MDAVLSPERPAGPLKGCGSMWSRNSLSMHTTLYSPSSSPSSSSSMSSLFSQNATAGMQCVAVTTREIPNGQVVELVFSASSPHQNSPLNNPALMATPNDLDQPVDDINDIANLRRHHTISTARRPPRAHPRIPISEVENEDEFVGADWVAGAGGVVGEGKGLHRAGSLPSRYNNTRGMWLPLTGDSLGSTAPTNSLIHQSIQATDRWEHRLAR